MIFPLINSCHWSVSISTLQEGGGIDWSQVTASSILGLDTEGRVMEGQGEPELSGACIHLGVRRSRPGAKVNTEIRIIDDHIAAADAGGDAHPHPVRHGPGLSGGPEPGDDPSEQLQVPRARVINLKEKLLVLVNYGRSIWNYTN